MFVNVPITLVYSSLIKDSECLNTYLCLYANCLSTNKFKPYSKKEIELDKDEIIASKNYLSGKLNTTVGKIQSHIKRLKDHGLISVRKISSSKLNIIKVNTINPKDGNPYIQINIPGNPFDVLQERSKNIFKVYVNLCLLANVKDTVNVFNGMKIQQGELFSSYKALANQINCTIQELRTAFRKLVDIGGIIIEGVKRIGLKIKTLLNKKVREVNTELACESSLTHATQEDKVTKAMKRLYYGLKHNKDQERFNNLTETIRRRLPAGFPLEKMEDVLTKYYKDKGGVISPPLNAEDIISYIIRYNNEYQKKEEQAREKARIREAKRNELEQNGKNYNNLIRVCNKAHDLYHEYKKEPIFPDDPEKIKLIHRLLLGTGFCFLENKYWELYSSLVTDSKYKSSSMTEQLKMLFDKIGDDYLPSIKTFINSIKESNRDEIEKCNTLSPIRITTKHSISLYQEAIKFIYDKNPEFARIFMDSTAAYLCRHTINDKIVSEITITHAAKSVFDKWITEKQLITEGFELVFGLFTTNFQITQK